MNTEKKVDIASICYLFLEYHYSLFKIILVQAVNFYKLLNILIFVCTDQRQLNKEELYPVEDYLQPIIPNPQYPVYCRRLSGLRHFNEEVPDKTVEPRRRTSSLNFPSCSSPPLVQRRASHETARVSFDDDFWAGTRTRPEDRRLSAQNSSSVEPRRRTSYGSNITTSHTSSPPMRQRLFQEVTRVSFDDGFWERTGARPKERRQSAHTNLPKKD